VSPEATEIIAGRLRHLYEYLADLRQHEEVTWDQFMADKVFRRFVERTLHLAAECCLDVGTHILSTRAYREPQSNRDVFAVLEEGGLLNADLASRMKDMASFRNVVVHDYTRVDPGIVFGVLKRRLEDLEEFAKVVRTALGLEGE
jgi:uncharacterized protein YutE (UPF0331/DUF86 family)